MSAQQRNALFNQRFALLQQMARSGPPPSPDRTTGRERAGFASAAFTGAPLQDDANGFFPTVQAGRLVGYGTQAGNPKQQALAKQMQTKDFLTSVGKQLGGSPIGQVAGDVIANRTWAKIAPLLQRDPSRPPRTSFANTPPGTAGFEKGGRVTIDPSNLNLLLTSEGRGALRSILAHEYAHTQQGKVSDYRRSSIPERRGSAYSPALEGGANAFEDAVAPLLGYRRGKPTRQSDYGRAQLAFGSDLRKALIGQFPRVSRRLTPAKQRRVNLSQ